ncbi:hypothetical protein [Vibrio porteresiae]|uniref:Uncharacterized protein n=1 Tax=Vibrio porteresiae DSM 19223 TaxID=1123496 RepID=A0ABZ0QMW2_9VIBR|nr:hypothetical protein [Vibrio porteresiae]WPC76773.1 hypothetical protein R8Z52_19795 [Vibrio porteresiae DSM 19223]
MGKLSAEIVYLSKKGKDYHLNGQFWTKVTWLDTRLGESYINQNQVIKMSPLKDDFKPRWVNEDITISPDAKTAYLNYILRARISDIDSGVTWK